MLSTRRSAIPAGLLAALSAASLALPRETPAAVPDGFQDQVLAEGLAAPSSFAFLPDARLLGIRPHPYRAGSGTVTVELAQGVAGPNVIVYALDGTRVVLLR